ncbi:hypothetical protein BRD00_06660 [Halobacteriales archaeon QS_8_69_26]|nr:MAG: hypothetical protein BRD00_06660 [Halobacteriales archaeon QS_8_69_26]
MRGVANSAAVGRRKSRPIENLDRLGRRLVRSATEDGTATYSSVGKPPVRDGTIVRTNDSLHRVVVEWADDTSGVTGYKYDVKTNPSIREAATPGETIDLSELPPNDRTTLLASLPNPDQKLERLDFDVVIAYADRDAREASVFVPEPEYEYIRYGETVLRFRSAGTKTVTVTTYRIRLETVADSVTEYGDQVLASEGRRVDPSELSPDAREFVRAMLEEGSVERCYPLPDHVEEVMDAFDLGTGPQHVEYDGNWYEFEAFSPD